MATIVERAEAEQRDRTQFLDSIGAVVGLMRDLEAQNLEPVPHELAERIEDLAAKLACVAFFPTAPKAYVDEARALLERPVGGKHGQPWQLQLKRRFADVRGLLEDEDRRRLNARRVARGICLNVVTFAADAPSIFHRLQSEPNGAPERDLADDERKALDAATNVIERLQRSGIKKPGMKAGGGVPSTQAAAADFAGALGLPFERRASRLPGRRKTR